MNLATLYPTVYFLACLVGSLIVNFTFPVARIPAPHIQYVGIPLILFGIGLNLWADHIFHRHGTTVKPLERPTSLVTDGPFRLSRHPMYLGMFLVLLGESFVLGSVATLVMPFLFLLAMNILFTGMEESALEQEFGDEYREYTRRVRRWF